ncbi:MAG TPA: hypothetical protein ENI06_12520 [Spirochaetales bacterium]|nr:hypothetical protein [Spirochaetales bacterium]
MANNYKQRRKKRYDKDDFRQRPGYNKKFNLLKNAPVCPLCQKPVRDLYSAITHQSSNEPAHFDCILKMLRKINELTSNEKICYLGNGSFGIIQFRNAAGKLNFFIRKRLNYEETDPVPEWRKKLF